MTDNIYDKTYVHHQYNVNKRNMHQYTVLMQRKCSCAVALTQSKSSTRRSTLLLHRSHAVKGVRLRLSVGEEGGDLHRTSSRSRWFKLSPADHAGRGKGSCRRKGRMTQSNRAIIAIVEHSQLTSRVAGRAGVVVRRKKKTNDYPTVPHIHY